MFKGSLFQKGDDSKKLYHPCEQRRGVEQCEKTMMDNGGVVVAKG